MKIRRIRFDDPRDLEKPSSVYIDLAMDLQLLDFARRYFERKGDKSSLARAEEIRKFYKHTFEQYVYIIRSIIPDDVIHEHTSLFSKWLEKQEKT